MPEERKTAIVTDCSCDLSDEQLARYGVRLISLRVVCQNAEYRDRVDIQEDELYALLEKELPKTSLPLPEDVTALYEQLQAHNIRMISLRIVCQSAEYRDRVDMTQEKLYELLKSELPKTSLPLPEDVSTLYDRLLAEGYTDVIHMSISSGLSGTYNMVRMITEDMPMNIRVVDSKTLSTGLGMMVLEAARALESGATPDEAAAAALKARKTQLGMFVIRTLEYLRKGGRIGLVEGVVGSLLQIKPIIFVNDEGVYQTLAKARGFKSAVDAMVQEAKRRFGDAKVKLSVVNGHVPDEAAALLERLKTEMNVDDGAFVSQVSPVLAIHTGPGLLGIIANKADSV